MPMYVLSYMKAGADIYDREHPDNVYNYEMRAIGKYFYLPVYLLLESFSRVLQPSHIR